MAHGEYMKWLRSMEIDHTFAKRAIKIAEEIPDSATWHHLGTRALYEIATMLESERDKPQQLDSGV